MTNLEAPKIRNSRNLIEWPCDPSGSWPKEGLDQALSYTERLLPRQLEINEMAVLQARD